MLFPEVRLEGRNRVFHHGICSNTKSASAFALLCTSRVLEGEAVLSSDPKTIWLRQVGGKEIE